MLLDLRSLWEREVTTSALVEPGTARFLIRQRPCLRHVWTDTDELAVAVTPLTVDEEIWLSPGLTVLWASTLVHSDPDDHIPLGGFRLEDEYWLHPGTCPLTANNQPLTDTDEQAFLRVEFEQWEKPYQQTLTTSSLVYTDPGEHWPLGGFRLEDEYYQQLYSQTLPESKLVFSDPVEHWPLGGLRVEEDYFQAPTYLPYLVNRQVVPDTDDPLPRLTIGVEDEPWLRPATVAFWTNRLVCADENEQFAAPAAVVIREIVVRGNCPHGTDDYMESWSG